MLFKETKELYHHLLTSDTVCERLCCQVLRNVQTYLTEEEERMVKDDANCEYKCSKSMVIHHPGARYITLRTIQ